MNSTGVKRVDPSPHNSISPIDFIHIIEDTYIINKLQEAYNSDDA
jgi:hypothetical protein